MFLPIKSITVLIVDDEPAIRRLVRSALLQQGCVVIEADDGVAAYKLVQHHPDSIHLVTTDVVMPRMDGIALGNKATTAYFDVEMVHISGFVSDLLDCIPIERFLPEPSGADDLIQCVHNICA